MSSDAERDKVTVGEIVNLYEGALKRAIDKLRVLAYKTNNQHQVQKCLEDDVLPAMTKRDNIRSEAGLVLLSR